MGNQVCAGFPSPADDLGAQRIDLTQVLITHPQATYFLRVRGHSMIEAGILHDDMVIVARGRVVHQGACADAATHRALADVFDGRVAVHSLAGQWVALPQLERRAA